MAKGPSIVVSVLSDASKFSSGVKQAEQSTSRIGSAAKKVGGAIAAGFAVSQVKDFATASVGAAREAELANKRLEAVFRATGDTTGQAAKAAEDYAGVLSRKIGVDDEVIKGGQAILAGFKSVSSATARAAGIFDRATNAGADLAAKGIGSITSNAKLLGKALSDPTKGMNALKKAGVTLTDAQKDQIKWMQASGDKVGAQKALLTALEGTTKGVAASTATSADKMKVQWGEVQEKVGGALVPVIDKLNTALTATFTFIQSHTGLVAGLAIGFGVLALAIGALVVVQGISAGLAAEQGIAYAAVTIATGLWSVAQWILNAALIAGGVAMAVLTSPITLIVVGLAAVVAGVIYAYTHFKIFHDTVDAVWQFIKANWPLLISILLGPLGLVTAVIIKNWNTIKTVTMTVFGVIKSFLSTIWNGIRSVVTTVASTVATVVTGAWNRLKAATSTIFNALKTVISTVFGGIRSLANGLASFFGGIGRSIGTAISGIGRVFSALGDAARAAVDAVKGWFNGLVSFFSGIVGGISRTVGSIVSAIKGPINAVIGGINAIRIPSFSVNLNMPGPIPDIHFSSPSIDLFPNIPQLAAGGVLSSATLALVGEGMGNEIITPEALMRQVVRDELAHGGALVAQLNVQAWDPPKVALAIANELAYLEVRRRHR